MNQINHEAFKEKLQEAACVAKEFGVAYAESIIEAAESLERSQEVQEMQRILLEIMGLKSEKEATIVPPKKDERRGWRAAARDANERECARAHAFRWTMKRHKAWEVMRFKRQKRVYGGLA